MKATNNHRGTSKIRTMQCSNYVWNNLQKIKNKHHLSMNDTLALIIKRGMRNAKIYNCYRIIDKEYRKIEKLENQD